MMTLHILILFVLVMLISTQAFRIFSVSGRDTITPLSMVVAAKSLYSVTLLPGDGIGPEIMAATLPVLEAVGKKGKSTFD
jgi:hypothetical protein